MRIENNLETPVECPGSPQSRPLQALGSGLRDRRQTLGLTLVALSQLSGIAVGYLSMIERGIVQRPPSAARLRRLAHALGLDAHDLLRQADWARAEGSVRAAATAWAEQARRGRELAAWLRTAGQGGEPQAARSNPPGTAIDLDQLYASGQLQQRVDAVLNPADQAATPTSAPTPNPPPNPPPDLTEPIGLGPRIPLINKVAAGLPAGFTDLDYPARVADDYVPGLSLEDPDAFAATVNGRSMEPVYREGEVVVFSPAAPITDGCDCFVRLEPEHHSTFKRVRLHDESDRVDLVPLNPEFTTRTVERPQIAAMSRAVFHARHL
ncbi:MAG: LexA family transcriptional regulator [Planctomycetota bacterium]